MVTKLNPAVITDDMMYEGVDLRTHDGRPMIEHIRESKMWGDIHRAAKTNKTLQEALDHAIMIYKLSKEYKDGI
jgi:hypothetical protein